MSVKASPGKRTVFRAAFYAALGGGCVDASLYTPASVSLKIYNPSNELVETLKPSVVSTGIYSAAYRFSSNAPTGTWAQKWIWRATASSPEVTSIFNFTVSKRTSSIEEILNNIVSALEKITTANGYSTDLNMVSRVRNLDSFRLRDYPAAIVMLDSLECADQRYEVSTFTAHVRIDIIVGGVEDLDSLLSDVIADVVEALHEDVTRGGLAADTALVSEERDYYHEGTTIARGSLVFRIVYETKRGDVRTSR